MLTLLVDNSAPKHFEAVLRASRLFGRLDDRTLAGFAKVCRRRHFERRAALWQAGEPATSFTIIARGLVEIVRRGRDGADTILAIFGPRESIGDMAAVQRGPYPAGAIALTDVELLALPAPTVLEAMRADPEVAAAVNLSLTEHARALHEKIRIVTAGPVPRRLATLLLHLVQRFGDELEGGSNCPQPEGTGHHATIQVPVSLSRSELAGIVGATVETTIRTMSRWSKEGVVETTAQGFLVRNLEALRAMTEELPPDS
jgi:CRP-like cAMP-binding protein